MKRGDERTANNIVKDGLLATCKSMVGNSELGLCTDPDLTSDYDAISIVVTFQGLKLSQEQETAITELCMVYGTYSSAISFLYSPVAFNGISSIFSTANNHSQHQSKHHKSEIQVCDTPVKLAILHACKEKLIQKLNSMGWPVFPSNREGLCFNPMAASNKPSYGMLISALLDSCWVGDHENKKFYLHLANLGMRIPTKYLNEVFAIIKKMRCLGLTVEVPQLDIAFSQKVPKTCYFNISCKKNDSSNEATLNHGLDMFTLHELHHETHAQDGTIRLTKNKWTENQEKLIKPSHSDNGISTVAQFYKQPTRGITTEPTRTDTTTSELKISPNALYSLKIYSTLSHVGRQENNSIPNDHWKKMAKLPNLTISRIKSIISSISKWSERCFNYAKGHHIHIRFEVSIRPGFTNDENNLRQNGHLNDFLAHTAIFTGAFFKRYDVKAKCISPVKTQIKLNSLIQQISPLLRIRDSLNFGTTYPGKKIADMLRAYIYMMMTTVGIASSYKMKFYSIWLKDKHRIDPGNQYEYLSPGKFLVLNPITSGDETITNSDTDTELLQNQLTKFFDLTTVQRLVEYIQMFNVNTGSNIQCFQELSLKDKLSLICRLDEEILPTMITNDDREEVPADSREDEHSLECNEGDEICLIPDELATDEDILMDLATLGISEIPTELPLLGTRCRTIQALTELCPLTKYQITSANFQVHLSYFIIKCHNNQITLPEGLSSLTNLGIPVRSRLENILNQNQLHFSKSDLQLICNNLAIPVRGTNYSKETYIRSICLHYWFPCKGVLFPWSKVTNSNEQYILLNNLINETIHENFVIRQYSPNDSTHRTIIQTKTGRKMHILLPKNLIEERDNPPEMEEITSEQYGFSIINTLLDTQSSCEISIRQVIYNQLMKGSFSTNYLDSNGNTSDIFRGIKSLKELQLAHNFHLMNPKTLTEWACFNKFIPSVMLPAITAVYQKDITFYDFSSGKTFIIIYHAPSTTITYTYATLNVIPLIKSLNIIRVHCNKFTQIKVKSADITNIQEENYTRLSIRCKSRKRKYNYTTNGSTRLGNFKEKPHPMYGKPGIQRSSFPNSLTHCMIQTKHPCFTSERPDTNDPLQLQTAVYTLVNKESNHDTSSILPQLFDTSIMAILSSSIYTNFTELDSNIYTMCIFFVWKYRTPVTLLEIKDKQKNSLFFTYSRWEGKVIMKTINGHHLFDQEESTHNTIYIQQTGVNTIKWRCYAPPVVVNSNIYMLSLALPFSYIDEDLLTQVIQKIPPNDHYKFTNDMKDLDTSILLSKTMVLVQVLYPIIPEGLRREDFSWTIVFLFPFNNDTQKFDIVSISTSESASEMVKKHIEQMKSNLVDTDANHTHEHISDFTDDIFNHKHHDVPMEKECEWGYIIFLIIYISSAVSLRSEDDIMNKIRQLYDLNDLTKKARIWTIKFWHNNNELPEWLSNML